MGLHQQIESKLHASLEPERMNLVNESSMHNVPPGSETHFNLILVTPRFEGLSTLQRHRAVYDALGDELRSGLHALTMKTLTPSEWETAGGDVANPAPLCLGGSKAD